MTLKLNDQPKKKTDFGRIEDGTYPARVVQIIDLGQQVQTDWQTQEVKTWDNGDIMVKPEVYINFEFPTETITIEDDERPRWCGKQYILSNHEKAPLTTLMGAVADGSNNVGDALGEACTVTIGSTKTGNAKVTGVSAVMKGMTVADLGNPATVFDFDSPDMTVWEKIPNWLQDKIKEATNFNGSVLAGNLSGDEPNTEAQSAQDEPEGDDVNPF